MKPTSGMPMTKALEALATFWPEISLFLDSLLCTQTHTVSRMAPSCQLTTGESEINAAVTISSLIASNKFDLRDTYFLIAGIAGINPKHGMLGDVAFCKYAIQVALRYEFDAREIPSNFPTG
jgi:purine nucleoside permease